MEATLATYDIVAKHLDKPNYPELEILKGPVQDNCYACEPLHDNGDRDHSS